MLILRKDVQGAKWRQLLFFVAAAFVAAVAEGIGAGLTACGTGALTATATSSDYSFGSDHITKPLHTLRTRITSPLRSLATASS